MTTFTAKQFNKNPASVYRAADKGDVVRLNHDRYPDKIFELTARDRAPLESNQLKGRPEIGFNKVAQAVRKLNIPGKE